MAGTAPLRLGVLDSAQPDSGTLVRFSLSDVQVTSVWIPTPSSGYDRPGGSGRSIFRIVRGLLGVDPCCSICVPRGLLAPFALEAISYRKPLLLEEPMAITLEDADSIINAADRRVPLMIGLSIGLRGSAAGGLRLAPARSGPPFSRSSI